MKKFALLALIGLSSILCGCSSAGRHYDEANEVLLESARHYVQAADEALPEDPTTAQRYTGYAREVLGPPAEDLTTDELERRHKHDEQVLEDRRKAEKTLIDLGKQKEAENNKNLISRLWHWGLATFGLTGLIVVCILFPPIIPIILQIVTHFAVWWFQHFPKIVFALWNGISDAARIIKNSHKPPQQ
jgi:hypothetical protein